MDNGYEIEWSEQAVHDFDEIVQLLSTKWSEKEVRDFVRSLDKELNRICTFPYAFPATSFKSGVRRCVLSKINTLYYQVKNSTIYLITIYDNRRNPANLKQML